MASGTLLKKLAGESLIYGVSGMVSRFISVFLTPIYTGIFAPADYGVAGLVISLSALLNILVILSLDNSMARWYYDNENEDDRRRTLNTFLWSCVGAAVVATAAVVGFRAWIAEVFVLEPQSATLIALMGLNLPLSVFSTYTINVLRIERRPVATAAFTLTTSLLSIVLNVLFIIVLGWGLPGIFYAQLGTSTVAVVWTLALFRRDISPALFDRERWVKMFWFSAPLIPGTIAYWVINLSGAYFLQLMSSTHEVGLYQIALNLASGMTLFTGAFQMAWGPFAYSIHKEEHAKQVYARSMLAYLALTCLLGFGVMLFAHEVLVVLTNPNYYDAAFTAGLLAFNPIIIGLASIAAIGPGIANNNKAYGSAMIISALMLVGLNFLLVPRLGKEGAAASILLSQGVIPLVVFVHGQKIYPIPYRFEKAIFVFVSAFIGGIAGLLLFSKLAWPPAAAIAAKTFLLCLYGGLVFLVLRSETGGKSVFALGSREA